MTTAKVHQSCSRFLNQSRVYTGCIIIAILGMTLWASLSLGTGFKSPEECLAYQGDAHLNCLYAYIEIQKDKISKLEKGVQTQKETTEHLHNRLNQQTSITQGLTRQLEDEKNKSQGYQFNLRRPYTRFFYQYGSPYNYGPYWGSPFGYSYGGYYPWW